MGIFSFLKKGSMAPASSRGEGTPDARLCAGFDIDLDHELDEPSIQNRGMVSPGAGSADGQTRNQGDDEASTSPATDLLDKLTGMGGGKALAPDEQNDLPLPQTGLELDPGPVPGPGLEPGMGARPRLLHPLRMRMVEGVCHLSEELKGNLAVDDHLARMARERGLLAVPVVSHKPSAYEKLFGDGATDEGEDQTGSSKPDNQGERKASPLSATTWVDAYVRRLFEKAMAKKVSDIHITYMGPWTQVSFRRMGLVMEEESLDGPTGLQLVRGIFQGQLSQAESGFSEYERYDGRIADRSFLPRGLFAVRLHTEPIQSPHLQGPGITLAMRLLFDAASAEGTLTERLACLGFEKEQRELVESFAETTGMTVVSGPTGHGKTTVLKNILEALAETVPTRNYYSLEDPPEYTILGVRQLNVFTKAVSDEERERALLEALAGLMRSDPDVILLGEIRYLGAAKAAVNAALTGHAVWTTVHASSGLNVLARFREMGLPVDSALGVLAGVSYQRLLPTLCPHCKEPLLPKLDSLNPKLRERVQTLWPDSLEGLYLRGEGCSACDHLGLSGQKVACEVIPLRDRRMRELLSKGRVDEAQTYWVREMNGMTHVAHARARVGKGEVDPRYAEERLGVPLDSDLQDAAWVLRKSRGLKDNAGVSS